MNINTIITVIATGSKLLDTIMDLIDNVKGTLSEEDAAKVDAALAELQRRNDETFTRVSDKLKEAAKKP